MYKFDTVSLKKNDNLNKITFCFIILKKENMNLYFKKKGLNFLKSHS